MKALTARLKKAGVKIVLGLYSMIAYAETGWHFSVNWNYSGRKRNKSDGRIVAATMENARFSESTTGWAVSKKGKIADLILVKGNPIEDIRATRNVVK